jgi:hypothetical protein
VATGEVELAAVWGPLAGYVAQSSPVPLRLTPITGTEPFAPLAFDFAIAMGVRHGDDALKDRLDGVIGDRWDDIQRLLAAYGVPLLPVGDVLRHDDDD